MLETSLRNLSSSLPLSKRAVNQLLEEAWREAKERGRKVGWPDGYVNCETGKVYAPHNEDERLFVYRDEPRVAFLRGGEGAGKSVAGIVKNLGRIRRAMNGAMVSPDLEHFKKSLWPEFVRWCPWDMVIERHRYRREPGWLPSSMFVMTFRNELGTYSDLYCGGCKESEIGAWEGPNLSFVHWDECRRHKTAAALKVFMGRARIPGPNGEPPQVYMTSTPRKHWLYEYLGPIKDNDPLADFKREAFVGTVPVSLNIDNLDPNYLQQRALSLTAKEKRVLMDAEWEDEEDTHKFVNMAWWAACQEPSRAWPKTVPVVIGVDAATGGATATADCFAVVAVSRHPDPGRHDHVLVRYCGIWQPPPGQELDFTGPIGEIERLCREFAVVEVAYDKHQLFGEMQRLKRKGLAHVREFPQTGDRLIADRLLQSLIMSRRISHDGNPSLATHIDNSDFKKYGEDGIRIVKRSESQKCDGAVALSQACARILYYNPI